MILYFYDTGLTITSCKNRYIMFQINPVLDYFLEATCKNAIFNNSRLVMIHSSLETLVINTTAKIYYAFNIYDPHSSLPETDADLE